MGTSKRNRAVITAALTTVIGLATASICSAQGYEAQSNPGLYRGGQGGFVTLPSTTPAPASYALTGEQSQSAQSLQAWQKQVGPIYSFGNGSVVVSSAR
jgi:hypothetical protein